MAGFCFDFTFGFGFPSSRQTSEQDVSPSTFTPLPTVLSALPGAVPSPGVPTSTNPFPSGSRPPPFGSFPAGTAANDALIKTARRASKIFTRVIPGAGLIVTAAELAVLVLEKLQIDTIGDILIRQDADIAALLKRLAKEKAQRKVSLSVEKRVRALLNAPETFDPTPVEPVRAPSPQTLPVEIPSQVPGIFQQPLSIPLPQPGTIQAPSPVTEPAPQAEPAPIPTTEPLGLPERFGVPAPFELPGSLPVQLPFQSPVTLPLTAFDPVPLPSGLPQLTTPLPGTVGRLDITTRPIPLQQTRPDRKCEEVKRRRRRKGKCREGFFKEFAGKTQFITWRERDCATTAIRSVT